MKKKGKGEGKRRKGKGGELFFLLIYAHTFVDKYILT